MLQTLKSKDGECFTVWHAVHVLYSVFAASLAEYVRVCGGLKEGKKAHSRPVNSPRASDSLARPKFLVSNSLSLR